MNAKLREIAHRADVYQNTQRRLAGAALALLALLDVGRAVVCGPEGCVVAAAGETPGPEVGDNVAELESGVWALGFRAAVQGTPGQTRHAGRLIRWFPVPCPETGETLSILVLYDNAPSA